MESSSQRLVIGIHTSYPVTSGPVIWLNVTCLSSYSGHWQRVSQVRRSPAARRCYFLPFPTTVKHLGIMFPHAVFALLFAFGCGKFYYFDVHLVMQRACRQLLERVSARILSGTVLCWTEMYFSSQTQILITYFAKPINESTIICRMRNQRSWSS